MRSDPLSPDAPTAGRLSLLSLCALLWGIAGSVCAEEGRPAVFGHPQAASQERRARELPNFAPDFLRNQAQDEGRAPPRRWSPEERQQLRRDVHDAGRDVYGGSPRRN